MSIFGSLEDVSLADVLQFVHLGRSTGTLHLVRGDEQAAIAVHRGRIITASTPGTVPLGELLVSNGVVTRKDLAHAIELQNVEQPRRPLGQVIEATGAAGFEEIQEAMRSQIEETIFELVTWKEGDFSFARDELGLLGDFARYPGDTLSTMGVNIERVLIDLARVVDELARDPGPAPARAKARVPESVEPLLADPPSATDDWGDESEREELEALDHLGNGGGAELSRRLAAVQTSGVAHPRLQVLSTDDGFVDRLRPFLTETGESPSRVNRIEAGSSLPGEPAPIVVVDVGNEYSELNALRRIKRLRPLSSIVAVVDSVTMASDAYQAGATAAVPDDPQAVALCLESLLRERGFGGYRQQIRREVRAGFSKLRRIVADLRSGFISTTMALNLMNILSESVERAILFLVRHDELTALGAFGFGPDQTPLADLTRGMRISLDGDSALAESVTDGQSRSIPFDATRLKEDARRLLGRPAFDQVVILPVMGTERVISVIYADNGPLTRAIADVDLLELATAQVGMAFENELLRRQVSLKGG